MSANKFKYYEITTRNVVKANSKSDAIRLIDGAKGVDGTINLAGVSIKQLPASEAHRAVSPFEGLRKVAEAVTKAVAV
jgi:hypothetical protein